MLGRPYSSLAAALAVACAPADGMPTPRATIDTLPSGALSRTQVLALCAAALAVFLLAVFRLGSTLPTPNVNVKQVNVCLTQAASGDQLLLFVSTNAAGTTSVSTPAGWTRVLDPTTSGSRHAVFSKVAAAGDPGANVTVTLGTAAKADVVIAAYRGLRVAPSGAAKRISLTVPAANAPSSSR